MDVPHHFKMKTTLILTPNKNEQCGMYQLAKDLAKEFDGEIITKKNVILLKHTGRYFKEYPNTKIKVITLLYPMHKWGKWLKEFYNAYWICYDQKIPPITKTYFPNFWRRQAMRYINWRNNATMKGADEYWNVTEREQKPRWTEKSKIKIANANYATYIGRRTDYKNFNWLQETMKELNIDFQPSELNESDLGIHTLISNAKMLVTASLWEGYGRPVMEAETLGIPAVAYDVGAHKRCIKKGICVPLNIDNMEKSEELFMESILEVWNRK